MLVITTIISGIFILNSVDLADDESDFTMLVFLYLSLFALNTPTKNGAFQYGKYILMLGSAIFFTWYMKQPEFPAENTALIKSLLTWFWIAFPIATVIGGWMAAYTRANISEVLSRRMLYRNSNVSLFEYAWKYTLDRFCNIAVAIVTCIIWIVVMIKEF